MAQARKSSPAKASPGAHLHPEHVKEMKRRIKSPGKPIRVPAGASVAEHRRRLGL